MDSSLSATYASTPADPTHLPPPLHTQHWRITPPPRTKKLWGWGGFLWRTCSQTFLTQCREWSAGWTGTHFKEVYIPGLCSCQQSWSTLFTQRYWVTSACPWWSHIVSSLEWSTWRPLRRKTWTWTMNLSLAVAEILFSYPRSFCTF